MAMGLFVRISRAQRTPSASISSRGTTVFTSPISRASSALY